MINCPNCGKPNTPQSKFCVNCGNVLNNNNQPQSENVNQTTDNIPNANVNNTQTSGNQTSSANTNNLNFIKYIIGILLRPLKSFNEEENKLSDTKNSIILALIVTVSMTLLNLIHTIIYTVRVSSYLNSTTSWDFSNLNNINYIQVIGKNFIIYACIILAITVVFYLGSLIIKKQMNIIKNLGIVATSMIPLVLGSMILSPILGAIWIPLGVIVTVVSAIYSVLILLELMNKELQLVGDVKIYFNLVCF